MQMEGFAEDSFTETCQGGVVQQPPPLFTLTGSEGFLLPCGGYRLQLSKQRAFRNVGVLYVDQG